MSYWVAGGTVVAGLLSAKSSHDASKSVKSGTDSAIGAQERQFDTVRNDTAGLRFIGDQALGRLGQLYGYGTPSKPLSFEEWSAQNPQAVAAETPKKQKHGGLLGHLKNALDPTEAFKDTGLISRGESATAAPGSAAYQSYLDNFKASPVDAGSPDMSAFFKSPDYQFNVDEGQQAIDRSAAARGGLLSGGAVKAGERYASGLASREYSSFVDRLMQQAGLGTTGIGASAAAGATAANGISGAYISGANGRANSYVAGASGINNAVQGGISNLLLSRYLGTNGGSGAGVQSGNYGYGPSVYGKPA